MEYKKADYLQVCPVGTIRIDDPFWNRFVGHLQENMVPHIYKMATKGNSLRLTKMAAGDIPFEPLPESGDTGLAGDITIVGWLEGAMFTLAHRDDKQIREWVEYIIDLFIRGQSDDGYMISYYNLYAKDRRLKGLWQSHELVLLADHLDAAVIHYQITGKRYYLDAVCRLCDFLYEQLGPHSPNPKLFDGHAGIEPALVKLYRVTGNEKYLELAKHFVDVHGIDPDALQKQWREEGNVSNYSDWDKFGDNKYIQAHKPVREQDTAEGHAVRALYLYTGMIDVYMETGDESLLRACETLYNNMVGKRMYISGGLGSCCLGERFTADYDLPVDTMYCESCANVAMTFFCRRMFQSTRDAKYLDTLELEMYNAVPAGTSLDGKHFFYVNPLEVWPTASENDITKQHILPERPSWLDVSCCPPNLQSALAGLDGYVYYTGEDTVYMGLFLSGDASLDFQGKKLGLHVETRSPFDGLVRTVVDWEGEFTLALRKPGWAERTSIAVNGEAFDAKEALGMLLIRRVWKKGDVVEYSIPMEPRLIVSHPRVRATAGRAAIMRGPLLYCLEEADNGDNLGAISLKSDVRFREVFEPALLGGTLTLELEGQKLTEEDWGENELYRPFVRKEETVRLKAIPYCLWQNRGKGELQTWLPVR